MGLPDHTRRLAERLLGAYCEGVCPPALRTRVELGFRLERDGATLYERRRICGVPGTARAVDVARLRYHAGGGEWQLYWSADYAGSGPRWRRHPRLGRERNLARLLAEIDADPEGRFWPRLNGASLRWCSAGGRCAGCAARYRAVLGAG
jgi:hypothetical protein